MIIAVLGIMKAGGAFLALDPNHPQERLNMIAADANLRYLVTESHLRERLSAAIDVSVDLDDPRLADASSVAPGLQLQGRDLAYLMYTSGSTGRPKGVMIEHRNITHLMRWVTATFSRAQLAKTLVSSTLSFDVSMFEIFAPLVTGGTAVIARDILEMMWTDFKNEITLFCSCSSPLMELARARKIPSSVQVIIQAGEIFPLPLIRGAARCNASSIDEYLRPDGRYNLFDLVRDPRGFGRGAADRTFAVG